MAIVVRGLGQPEHGAIVTAGLGTSEPAAPGTMSALLSGSASISASIEAQTSTGPTPGGAPGAWRQSYVVIPRRPAQPRRIAATITASSRVTATAVVSFNFDAELEALLLVDAI